MADLLHFELVTPERLVRSEDVHMVVVPGSEGEFGAMAGHAPLMTTLKDGPLTVFKTRDDYGQRWLCRDRRAWPDGAGGECRLINCRRCDA